MGTNLNEIQKELLSLTDPSIWAKSIRAGAKEDYTGCIKMIISQAKDNRKLVSKIIGEELLSKIEKL